MNITQKNCNSSNLSEEIGKGLKYGFIICGSAAFLVTTKNNPSTATPNLAPSIIFGLLGAFFFASFRAIRHTVNMTNARPLPETEKEKDERMAKEEQIRIGNELAAEDRIKTYESCKREEIFRDRIQNTFQKISELKR